MSAVVMAECVDCERNHAVGDLATVDGKLVCEPCVAYRQTAECADCDATHDKADLQSFGGEWLCADCVEARDDDGDQCGACDGTGEGRAPDSRCGECGGGGVRPLRRADFEDWA